MKVFKSYISNLDKNSTTYASTNKLITDNLSTTNLTFTDQPYSSKEIKEGSTKVKYKSTRKNMNLKEWLHVRLNHASEAVIDWVVQNDICLGVGVTWSDIKNLHLGACDTCQRSRMKKFNIRPSISRKTYGIFEYISGDYVKFKKPSIRKYTGAIIYVDKCTGKIFEYKVKAKSEWLHTLKRLIKEYGKDRYPRCLTLRYLLTDYATEVHSTEFTEFLAASNIELLNSTPYLHEQNLVERYIQILKNMLRSALLYNRAPYTYWCYALTYVTDTFNMLPRLQEKRSPNEAFFGEKQDVSKCVPFYSSGWYHLSAEERLARPSDDPRNLLDERSEPCIMLGYTNPYIIPDKTQARVFIKNAYIIYNPITKKQLPRHDCLFKNYSDLDDPLNSEVTTQIEHEDDVSTYDDIFEQSVPNIPKGTTTRSKSQLLNKTNNQLVEGVVDEDESDRKTVTTPNLTKSPHISSQEPTAKHVRFSFSTTQNSNNKKTVNENIYLKFIPSIDESLSNPTSEPVSTLDIGDNISSYQPTSLAEALTSQYKDNWSWAMKTEMERLGLRGTWTVQIYDPKSPEFKNIKPIKSKLAFRASVRPNGTIKFRSRLVACGYSQRFGIDYDTTYCPTCKYKSLCIVLHLAAIHGWHLQGIDVENAFIEPVIDKPIYMFLPKDIFCDPKTNAPVVVKLNKSIYGLKQAGDLWYKLVNEQLINMKYNRTIHDNCIYTMLDNQSKTYIVVYVDDILFIGNNMSVIDSTINTLVENLTKITEVDKIDRYIGIDIVRNLDDHTISLTQYPYTMEYINKYVDPDSTRVVETPLYPTVDYQVKSDETLHTIQEEIGKLRFLADKTRPDIATAVGQLGQNAAEPSLVQTKGLKILGEYLKHTHPAEPLRLGGSDSEIILFGYSDASNQPQDKSRLGYCFYLSLDSGIIFARSHRAKSVSHSSCESEIMAIDEAVRQVIWLRGFLEELGFTQNTPTVIYTDSQSAIALCETFNVGSNSVHLTMRLNYLHECIENKIIRLVYINTDDQVADILTKILPIHTHKRLTKRLLRGHGNELPVTSSLLKKTQLKKSYKRIVNKFKK